MYELTWNLSYRGETVTTYSSENHFMGDATRVIGAIMKATDDVQKYNNPEAAFNIISIRKIGV